MAKKKRRAKARRPRSDRRGAGGRWRRRLGIAAAVLLIPGALVLAVPRVAAALVEDEVGLALGGRIEIATLRGWTGRTARAGGVRWFAAGSRRPFFAATEVRCRLDRPLHRGLPERLETLEILGARWEWPSPTEARAARPVDAPAPAPEPGAAPEAAATLPSLLPEVIQVRHGRIDVRLGSTAEAFVLPVTAVSATARRTAPHRVEITTFEGRLFGGAVRGEGSYDLREPGRWRLQLRVADVDLAAAVASTRLETTFTRGTLGAFLELRGPAPGQVAPRGAGWISARQSHVWEVPVFSGILDAFGLLAGEGDYVRRLRVRFLLDDGMFRFSELVALGSPVSLYGNGSMDLDGRRIEADFVPRIGRGLLEDLPIVGQPGQMLLDLFKGATMEVQLRGELDAPRVSVLPLPVITRPIQDFLELVGG